MRNAPAGQVVHATATMSLEREAALISKAAVENQKAPVGALDFDLQVQDMSKVMASPPWHPVQSALQDGAIHL